MRTSARFYTRQFQTHQSSVPSFSIFMVSVCRSEGLLANNVILRQFPLESAAATESCCPGLPSGRNLPRGEKWPSQLGCGWKLFLPHLPSSSLLFRDSDLQASLKAPAPASSALHPFTVLAPPSLLHPSQHPLCSARTWTDKKGPSPFNLADPLLAPTPTSLAGAQPYSPFMLLDGKLKCYIVTECIPGQVKTELGVIPSLALYTLQFSLINMGNWSHYSLIKLDSSQEKSLYLNREITRWRCCPTQRQQPELGLTRAILGWRSCCFLSGIPTGL